MSNIAITPANLTAFRTGADSATAAATSEVADATETFEFTATGKPFIVMASLANTHGPVALTTVAGDGWAGKAISLGTTVQNKVTAFLVESGYGVNTDGKVEILATPASGKKLLTDHALTLRVIQL